jgi:hypothetical protein
VRDAGATADVMVVGAGDSPPPASAERDGAGASRATSGTITAMPTDAATMHTLMTSLRSMDQAAGHGRDRPAIDAQPSVRNGSPPRRKRKRVYLPTKPGFVT